MNEKLKNIQAQLYIFHQEALSVFQELANQYDIQNVFSHQEIGNKLTYDRDIAVQHFCKQNLYNMEGIPTTWCYPKIKIKKQLGKIMGR
jgi:deoxyribodipyrimidine photolyase